MSNIYVLIVTCSVYFSFIPQGSVQYNIVQLTATITHVKQYCRANMWENVTVLLEPLIFLQILDTLLQFLF